MFVFSLWKGRRKEKDSPTPIADEYKQYLEEDFIRDRITDADLETLVELPPDLDSNEWLATHTISFFEHINLLYGTISEFCTSSQCTAMTGPGNTQYLWLDEKNKKCKVAAPQYIDYVMSFIQKIINEESVFPTKYGNVFPSAFDVVVKKIHRYLFQVLAHIYQSHFKEIVTLNMHGHLNTLFLHFMLFNRQFNLTDEKETDILHDLSKALEVVQNAPSVPPFCSSNSNDDGDSGDAGDDDADTAEKTEQPSQSTSGEEKENQDVNRETASATTSASAT